MSRNILSPWARHRQVRCRDIEISNTAGRTTTNALFLDIDGTVTQGIYIDDDGTLTTGIRIDGTPSGGAIDLSNLTDEAGQCNIILGGAGRIVTGSAAGSAMDIDATTYQWTQGIELRYAVSDWIDTYTLTEFTGMYLRVENTESSSAASIYGTQIYGVSNNVANTKYIWGALIYAYVKGAAGVTSSGIYALQPEITFDAATASSTITDACIVRAKLTGGTMSDYTVLDGYRLTLGDMNGGSRAYGNGMLLEDDSGMSGTCTLTTGININIGTATAISIAGACTTAGISITGTCAAGQAFILGSFGTPLSYTGNELVEIHGRQTSATGQKPLMRVRTSTTSGTAMTTGAITAIQAQAYNTGTDNAAGMEAIQAHVGFKAAAILVADLTTGLPNMRAGWFKIEDLNSNVTITGSAACVVLSKQWNNASTTLSGDTAYIWLLSQGAVSKNLNAVIEGKDYTGSGLATYLLDLPTAAPAADSGHSHNTAGGEITIKIGGNDRYIRTWKS